MSVDPTIGTSSLVERVKNILMTPGAEWDRIDSEQTTIKQLFTGYVMILAAIPSVCGFIGGTVVGVAGFHTPIVTGLVGAIVTYALALASVYVTGLIIEALAPSFGGEKNQIQAFKVAAYAPTASWIAGVFGLIPMIAILAIIGGLYSLYLLYLGLPKLMKTPADKALPYTAVVIVVAIVVSIVATSIATSIGGLAILSGGAMAVSSNAPVAGSIGVPGVGSIDLAKLDAASKQMQASAAAMQSGDASKAVQPVAGEVLSGLLPASRRGLCSRRRFLLLELGRPSGRLERRGDLHQG
jgi:hypothetical protein